MKDFYKISNITFHSRLWACVAHNFRLGSCALPLDIAEQVIRRSDTDIIIRYVPAKGESFEREDNLCLIEELVERLKDYRYIELVCTKLARSSKEAVEMAKKGVQFTKAKLIKLGVFDDNNHLNNNEVFQATKELTSMGYKNVVPFIRVEIAVIRELIKLGIPAIRILASEIGSKRGIDDPDNIRRICDELNIPVIIEGGIGNVVHAKQAMLLGATAILVSSAIVKSGDPVAVAESMKQAVIEGRTEYVSKKWKK